MRLGHVTNVSKERTKMKEYSIDVNLTEEDLYDLQRDRSFKWNWTTNEDEKVTIKIHLFKGEEVWED